MSNERLANEVDARQRLDGGELGLDMYGLREALSAMGVEYIDSADDHG